jgi:bifunctional non-homologous end joining protein LigD
MKKIAEQLSEKYSEKITVEARKNKRRGRLFLDYMRNAYGQTSIVPYSLRALPGAPVAVPLDWDELPSLSDPQKYTIKNIFKRLARKNDPWKDLFKKSKKLNM